MSLRGSTKKTLHTREDDIRMEKKFKLPVDYDNCGSYLFLIESMNDAINSNFSLHYAYFVQVVWGLGV